MRGFVLSSLNQSAFAAVNTNVALKVWYDFHPKVVNRLLLYMLSSNLMFFSSLFLMQHTTWVWYKSLINIHIWQTAHFTQGGAVNAFTFQPVSPVVKDINNITLKPQ